MWLLVQYIDSEFPDYDIVNKARLLKIRHDKKNIKLVRSESDQSVHRVIIIQESEHEFRLKVVKDMLLKQHREKRVSRKERRNKVEGVTITKRSSSRVYYRSTDSDTDSENAVSNKSRQGIQIKNEIANSISGISIHEPQSSSDSCMEFPRSPSTKSTSTPYPGVNTSTSTVSHLECMDQGVQTKTDRMTKTLEEILTNGERVQEEMIAVLKMFEEFKKFPGSPESSPEIRRMRKRITNSKNNSLDSSKNTNNNNEQKKIIAEHAERVRQKILNVLNMYNELDSYPEAYLYKEKKEKYASSDEMVSDPLDPFEATSNEDDSDYIAE